MNRALRFWTVWVSASAATLACSGENAPAAGSAGNPSDGAAGSMGVTAMGGAAATPPAQGNVTLSVESPISGASTCPVPGKNYALGNPKAPNGISAGDRLADGENGATIECSVLGSGPYTFAAVIRGLSSEHDQVTLTITNGVVNADQRTGSATVAVFTPQLASTYRSAAGACPVSVIAENVKPGSLWATVACPSITDPSTGASCAVGATTTFVIENCDAS